MPAVSLFQQRKGRHFVTAVFFFVGGRNFLPDIPDPRFDLRPRRLGGLFPSDRILLLPCGFRKLFLPALGRLFSLAGLLRLTVVSFNDKIRNALLGKLAVFGYFFQFSLCFLLFHLFFPGLCRQPSLLPPVFSLPGDLGSVFPGRRVDFFSLFPRFGKQRRLSHNDGENRQRRQDHHISPGCTEGTPCELYKAAADEPAAQPVSAAVKKEAADIRYRAVSHGQQVKKSAGKEKNAGSSRCFPDSQMIFPVGRQKRSAQKQQNRKNIFQTSE